MAGSISATTAALISAAVGAAGVGTGLYESSKANDASQAAAKAQQQALAQQQQAQANQANLAKQEAVLGAQGQTQAQTGGSLTDPGTASFTNLLAGYPGFHGGSASPVSSAAGAAPSEAPWNPSSVVSGILASLRNGAGGEFGGTSLSGGNWQTPSAPSQRQQQLSDSVL